MQFSVKVVLVSHCSALKAGGEPVAQLKVSALPRGSVHEIANEWRRRVRSARSTVRAQDLYRGAGADLMRQARKTFGGSWYIVSAGHGLVSSRAQIPSYDLSVSKGPSSVLRRLTGPARRSRDWWKALTSGNPNPLKQLVERQREALVVIALSASYVSMVKDELVLLSESALRRVRIVGVRADVLPPKLRSIAMPYDRRLNSGRSGVSGGQVTFAQRAAVHFLTLCKRAKALARDCAEHARLVTRALSHLRSPRRTQRRKASDRRVLSLIRRFKRSFMRSAHGGLRWLRQEQGIACEQSRFARLWARAAG